MTCVGLEEIKSASSASCNRSIRYQLRDEAGAVRRSVSQQHLFPTSRDHTKRIELDSSGSTSNFLLHIKAYDTSFI